MEHYVGVMSGTSVDGCDLAEISIDDAGKISFLRGKTFPFENNLKNQILEISSNIVTSIVIIAELEHRISLFFADCINKFLELSLNKDSIIAIGVHGQTVWHRPPITVQIVNPNLLAVKTGKIIIADFRRMDVALGGQGAPLIPAFHNFLFSDLFNVVVLNMGGIANITVLQDKVIGYDTGPANILIDEMVRKLFSKDFDKNAEIAKKGKVDNNFLSNLLSDEYFKKGWPKSTGREYFNYAWLQKAGVEKVNKHNVITTLTKLSAKTIGDEIKKFYQDNATLVIHGGGANNSLLVSFLQDEIPNIAIKKSEDYNIQGDFLEAAAFAWFAYMRIKECPANIPSVTGALEKCLLGAIYKQQRGE